MGKQREPQVILSEHGLRVRGRVPGVERDVIAGASIPEAFEFANGTWTPTAHVRCESTGVSESEPHPADAPGT